MKRFWKEAQPVADAGGWRIELDGRPLRTPARALLVLPTAELAEEVACEWRDSPEVVDPRTMPMTGLGNAALDRVAADGDGFAASLARYGESDLLTYRAESPAGLVERQAAAWDPLLQWARRRFDVDFVVTGGITFVPQPPNTVARLAHAVAALDAFRLAALSPMVTIGGSLVAALAVLEREVSPEQAWSGVSVDDAWQLEKWGSDAEAEAALENRRRDFLAAARFLTLLD